ncbi:MAG TPA: hypothetical protein VK638_46400 [Edaphobacter sp.]|nr:hypothetical protein [Edaphobacter sp.]
MKEQMENAIEEIGGEPLEGSGFENETPDGQHLRISENPENN